MISFLVAMSKNRVIGKNNDLPWHLPADLAYFKRTTMHHTIVMGRKTHESIGRALPGRRNIVVTTKKNYRAEGCEIVHSVDEAMKLLPEDDEVFVIGGSQLFKAFYPFAERLYVTYIDEEFAGDTFFPEIDESEWKRISTERGEKNEKNPYDYFYIVYERK